MQIEKDLPSDQFNYRRFAVGFGMAAFLALLVDGTIARMVAPISKAVKHSKVAEEIKEPGHFLFVVIVAGFVGILHPQRWRGAAVLWVSGILAGLFYTIAKWPIGRIRPIKGINPWHIEPFRNGWAGILHVENSAFPSGHTCLAFATAACMSHLLPRGKWVFFGIASVVGLERVAEQAHYLSDVIAGAAFGILAFRTCLWIENRWFTTQSSSPRVLPQAAAA